MLSARRGSQGVELVFNRSQIPQRDRGLTFDDVLLVPRQSEMRSRRDPDLTSFLTRGHQLKIPFVSANMDTVTEFSMASKMDELGGFGIIHRFMSIKDQINQVQKTLKTLKSGTPFVGASIGVNPKDRNRATELISAGVKLLTVDISHGHSTSMLETINWLKSKWSDISIIAGNVVTPEGTQDLINAGADAVKVGIGPGSMCTTRIITGCGIPQLTAIALCSQVGHKKNIPIIADGGIRTSGDIVKALSAGASTVMLGSVLSGTLETPGEIQSGHKLYRGMASKSAQDSWRGGVSKGMVAEGESVRVPLKSHVEDVINELSGGLRSGMTYLNANSIGELSAKAQFMEISPMGQNESRAHGLEQTSPTSPTFST